MSRRSRASRREPRSRQEVSTCSLAAISLSRGSCSNYEWTLGSFVRAEGVRSTEIEQKTVHIPPVSGQESSEHEQRREADSLGIEPDLHSLRKQSLESGLVGSRYVKGALPVGQELHYTALSGFRDPSSDSPSV